jgi:hypothetical protein
MLTINDLHNERQLSSFEMGKIVGGTEIIINNPTVQLDGSGSPGVTFTESQLRSLLGAIADFSKHHRQS